MLDFLGFLEAFKLSNSEVSREDVGQTEAIQTCGNLEKQAPSYAREKSVSGISGISEGDAVLLKKAFGINTIQELAENKYVTIAQLVTTLVSLAKILGISL